jgi:hypothetical protein
MFRRLSRQVGFVFSAVLVAAIASGMALPSQAPVARRIVAIGDLHGDCAVWRDIARAARLIDGKNHWTGGNTILVQDGDVLDRGPDSLDIIRDLQRLQREAPRAGGRVFTMVGNHEAMNVTGDLRYVSPGEYAAFADRDSVSRRLAAYTANREAIEAAARTQNPALTRDQIRDAWIKATPLGMIEHRLAWRPAGELGRWATGNPAVVMLGGTLFVHGGISSVYATLSADEINRRVSAALAAGDTSPTSIINEPMGPLWYRGLVAREPGDEGSARPLGPPIVTQPPPRPTIDKEIDMVLKAFGAKRIVIAHTPILSGITITHGGKLIRIDTGNSEYYGGTPSYLEIIGDEVEPHAVTRTSASGKCSK